MGDVFIKLPKEAGAAAAWENHYAGKLEEAGFVWGSATLVSLYNLVRGISLVVHGDGFTFSGTGEELDWIEGKMKEWYEVRVRARLGPGDSDDKQAILRGRILGWHDWEGLSCEADPVPEGYKRYFGVAGGLKELDRDWHQGHREWER